MADVFGGILYELERVGFPYAGQSGGVHFAVGNEGVENVGLSDGSCNDGQVAVANRIAEGQLLSGDGFDVSDDATGNRCNHFSIVFANNEHGVRGVAHDGEATCRLGKCQVGHGLQGSDECQNTNCQIS